MERYTAEEWKGRIASLGRRVDVRNFPDVAADILKGNIPAFLGLGCTLPRKCLNPKHIGGLVIWTKGPVDILIKNEKLFAALKIYQEYQAVIGLQLSVTGFGGQYVEPGIPKPEDIAAQLKEVFKTGLIDPQAVTLRYDPVMKLRTGDGKYLRNDTESAINKVFGLFANLGINRVESKPLLAAELTGEKYHHVWQRLQDAGLTPISFTEDEIREIYKNMSLLALKYGFKLMTCCIAATSKIAGWNLDQGCLDSEQLSLVGKKLYGESWARLTSAKRASRTGCKCSAYWDLSTVEGLKKCGKTAACLYCTACAKSFGKEILDMVENLKRHHNGEAE